VFFFFSSLVPGWVLGAILFFAAPRLVGGNIVFFLSGFFESDATFP